MPGLIKQMFFFFNIFIRNSKELGVRHGNKWNMHFYCHFVYLFYFVMGEEGVVAKVIYFSKSLCNDIVLFLPELSVESRHIQNF